MPSVSVNAPITINGATEHDNFSALLAEHAREIASQIEYEQGTVV